MNITKPINEMNQSELIEHSNYLGALSNETFEETASRLRKEDDDATADIFDEMNDRWFDLENAPSSANTYTDIE
jgi:hypothetical protein